MKNTRINNLIQIIIGITVILLVFSSSVVVVANNPTIPLESENDFTNEEIKRMQDDLVTEQSLAAENELTEESLEYFSDYWSPGWWNRTLPSEMKPKLFDIPEEEILGNWVSSPGYSYSEESDGEFNVTNIQTPQKSITIRTSESEDTKTYSKTTITGQPEVNLITPDVSEVNDIVVPIVPRPAGAGAALPIEYNTIEKIVEFGIDVTLADLDRTYTKQFLIVKFNAWAKVKIHFRLIFPVKMILEFPSQIYEGEDYEFRCRLLPLDLPKEEFLIDIDINIGANVQLWGLWPYQKQVTRWRIRNWRIESYKKWVTRLRWAWATAFGGSIVKRIYESSSYETPLSGDFISVNFPEIELLSLVGGTVANFMSNFVSLGLGLGRLDLYGNMVTGMMALFPSLWNSRLVEWTESNQTNKIEFSISPSAILKQKSLDFSVTGLFYHFEKIVAHPYLFLRFKNYKTSLLGIPITIPCKDLFGEHQWNLPVITISTPFLIIPELGSITTSSSVTNDPTANYQFTIDVTEDTGGYGAFTGTSSQVYNIDISNPNLGAEQQDTILLEVSGLPLGYTAYFNEEPGKYTIRGDSLPPNPYFPSSSEATARLTVIRPRNIAVPSGEWSFDITATSLELKNMGDSTPSITKSASLFVPEIIDYDLKIEDGLYHVLTPGMNSITLFGQNLGNLNDTISVNATLAIEDKTLSWESDFPLDAYGSGSGETFTTSFDIDFSLNGIYPQPGLYLLNIDTYSNRLPYISQSMTVVLNFTSVYDVEASITPKEGTIFANWESNFTILLNNTGNAFDNFTIESSGWDEYLSFPTEVTNLAPLTTQELIVTLNISDPYIVNPDVYTFRITVSSDNGESAFAVIEADVTILAPDDTPPAITSLDVYSQLIDPELIYPQSPLTLGPSWEAFDEYPGTYWIYINNSLYTSGAWVNGTPIQAPVTGSNPLVTGTHNVTILFSDISGNIASDEKWIIIKPTDSLPPIINPIQAFVTFPFNYLTSQTISWSIEEEFLLHGTLSRNGTFLPFDDHISIESIGENKSKLLLTYTIDPMTLLQGKWYYTLDLQDMSNNFASSTIVVQISTPDTLDPVITHFPNSTGLLGRGEFLSVNATDQFPDRYEFTVNSYVTEITTWQSGVPISYEIDSIDLSVGANNLEIVFYDLAGNSISHPWTFTLQDIDPPTLLDFPSDFIIFEHNFTILDLPFWAIEDPDQQPGTYEIYKTWSSTELVVSGTWVPGNASIMVPAIDLPPGVYTYEAYFYDASGNLLTSDVVVTVLDVISPVILLPPNIQFEPLFSPDWFELITLEKYPELFTLYRNGTIVNEGELLFDFPIVFERFVDLSNGVYNYTLVIEDESGNIGEGSLLVKISDYTPPLIKRPPDITYSEGSTQNTLIWEIREANPYNYSIYRNDALILSGAMTTNYITISIDGLGLGAYKYTLIVFDTNYLSHSCVSYVNVIDVTPPMILHIGDLVFEEGDEFAEIIWQVQDMNPNTYLIKANDTDIGSIESWDGGEINLYVTGWSVGTYIVELIVTDTSGLTAISTLKVVIVPEGGYQPTPGFTLISILGALLIILRRRKSIKTKRK
jgi:hypothetical protein